MKIKQARKEDPEISLISLIDVVLMLVIFFMLSSTFVEEGRMKVQLPTAVEAARADPAERIVVTVTEQGSYRVNERELANAGRDTLRRAMAEVAGESRDARVVLRADAHATHQAVVTAMDVLGRMGFAQLDIATIQAEPTP
ncbi:MAG TPA: biopolymer transporter ExbD [Steroidobacteraceae bacterium]|nr:biopolymer transporter ExbD [Steroidobacteraceae bacterium]